MPIHVFTAGAFLGACHEPCICVSDGVAISGSQSILSAVVDQHDADGRPTGIPAVPVRFYSDDKLLGEVITDETGAARLTCELPPGTTRFQTHATVGRAKITGEGHVFGWPKERTVIICDIDGTISNTHYRELVFDKADNASWPLDDAAEVLNRLAERYGLIYLTARPAFLKEKTRHWLDTHGFPRAPLVSAPSLSRSISPQKYKAEQIHRLQAVLKNIRIGIGDAKSDSEAYAMENLLTLMIDRNDGSAFRAHAIVMRDWQMLARFFDANANLLEDPTQLQAAISGEQLVLRPILRYQPPTGRSLHDAIHAHPPRSEAVMDRPARLPLHASGTH